MNDSNMDTALEWANELGFPPPKFLLDYEKKAKVVRDNDIINNKHAEDNFIIYIPKVQ